MDHQENPFTEDYHLETSHLEDASCCCLLEHEWLIKNCV